MTTFQVQAVWETDVWLVYVRDVGLAEAWTVNGARQNARRLIAEYEGLDPDSIELDFRAQRWFDPQWWPAGESEDRPHKRRREAQLNDLARAAQSGSEGAINAFLEARRDG